LGKKLGKPLTQENMPVKPHAFLETGKAKRFKIVGRILGLHDVQIIYKRNPEKTLILAIAAIYYL